MNATLEAFEREHPEAADGGPQSHAKFMAYAWERLLEQQQRGELPPYVAPVAAAPVEAVRDEEPVVGLFGDRS